MAFAGSDQPLGVRLEDMDGVERALAQRRFVLVHGAVGDAIERIRIDAGTAEVVGQTDPWRRHFGYRCEAQAPEVAEAEVRSRLAADDEERIARHHVAKADEVRARFAVAGHHHPQRAAPHHVDLAGAQRLGRLRRAG